MGRRSVGSPESWDEFEGDGESRDASVFDLASNQRRWEARLAGIGRRSARDVPRESGFPPREGPRSSSHEFSSPTLDLALPAFSLIRGGDLFEHGARRRSRRTEASLLDAFTGDRLRIVENRVSRDVVDLALANLLRVLSGNPAVCRRMILCKPIRVVAIPLRRDFREYGFPAHTNPRSAGIFWNRPSDEEALLGLREECIEKKPWLMTHEMTHAVHLLAFTRREREDIDRWLMPVYRSRLWVEEAVAIYAERTFGALYDEDDLRAPGLYGKTRRDWDPQHVFSLFMRELFRPE